MKKLLTKGLIAYVSLFLLVLVVAGVTYASFTDKSKILGSRFSVGSADIKLLLSVSGGVDSSNLADDILGPNFSGISPNWTQTYLVKVYNNGTSSVGLTTNANYLTADDPDDLRSIIFVEPFTWNDTNANGLVDEGELGASYGKKTIVKWKTEGFNLGTVESGNIKGLVLRFSTDAVSATKQGKTGLFDFEFSSIGL